MTLTNGPSPPDAATTKSLRAAAAVKAVVKLIVFDVGPVPLWIAVATAKATACLVVLIAAYDLLTGLWAETPMVEAAAGR